MKPNNFDFLRLAAATAVIWSHIQLLQGPQPLTHAHFGAAGVFTFFAISGYLVTGSWDRDPRASRFLARRFLRIIPGLVVVVGLSAFVLGPLATDLPLAQYFRDAQVLAYCRAVLLFPMAYWLPGVFEHNPYRWVVNGSLWTLPMEVLMYAGLSILGCARLWTATSICLLLAALSALAVYAHYRWWTLPDDQTVRFLTVNAAELVDCGVCFCTGALLAKCSSIPTISWFWVPVAAACYWFAPYPHESLILVFGAPYAAISFAQRPLPVIRSFGRFGDFSYGTYIYAFPLMQALIMARPTLGTGPFFAASTAFALTAAMLSWRLVEAPAMRLKRALNRKGRMQLRDA